MVGFLSSRAYRLLACLLVLSLFALVGCGSGSKLGTVQGKVKVDGTLANSGNVIFTSGDKGSIFAPIQPDGSYRAIGVPPGAAQVTVTGPMVAPGMADPKIPPISVKDGPGGAVDKPLPIPAKYAKAESSGLTYTVKGGSNTYDIDLTAK